MCAMWTVEKTWEYVSRQFTSDTSPSNLAKVKQSFIENDINSEALLALSESDLRNELKIESFGIRKMIMRAISKLRKDYRDTPMPESPSTASQISSSSRAGGDKRRSPQVNRQLPCTSELSADFDLSETFLSRLFDHDQTPAVRDSQRSVAICSYFVKRVLITLLKRLPRQQTRNFLELRGRILESNSEKRADKFQRIKMDMENLNSWDKSILEESLQDLPQAVKFEGSCGNILVPIFDVLGKGNLVLKFNTTKFLVEDSGDGLCTLHVLPFSLDNTTGNLNDKYDKWSPLQKAFWEANRCQTVRIFCAGGKTLVQISDALGLTPVPSSRYSKRLVCGNSKASIQNFMKYFLSPASRGRQGLEWRHFDRSNYDECALKRLLNLEYEQYKSLMRNRLIFLEEATDLPADKFNHEPIIIASSQRITLRRQKGDSFDDSFGHIIIDEGDYGFAGPDDGSGKGEWKKMRDNNQAAFITYYSGTTQNAQGCEIPPPFISISYKDLVLAEHVKKLCLYKLFGPKFRNILPDGALWNPREVSSLQTPAERLQADMCRRKILGTGLYASVCMKNPPKCVIEPYIRRALEVWLKMRSSTMIPIQLLVFAPKIGSRIEAAGEGEVGIGRSRPRRRRSAAAAAAAVMSPAEPKVETKELVRKLVPVFEAILRDLNATHVRVGCAIGSDAECDESVERFRRCELDILINIRVLERSADFPMIGAILDLHSHSTPEGSGRAGAYAAAIQRFTRAARIIDPSDPAIKAHPSYKDFALKLKEMRDDGVAQKMVIFELDLDPRDWILDRFCTEENTLLLTFDGRSEAGVQSLKEGGWVHVCDKDRSESRTGQVVDFEGDEGGATLVELEQPAIEQGQDSEDDLIANELVSCSRTWLALNQAIQYSDELVGKHSAAWRTFNEVLLQALDYLFTLQVDPRPRTLVEMRRLALSEKYGTEQALDDSSSLLTYIHSSFRKERQGDKKAAGSDKSAALTFVRAHVENVVEKLKIGLDLEPFQPEANSNGSEEKSCDPISLEAMKDLEGFIKSFEPTVKYTRPTLMDSFEDSKILISNYQQLKERVMSVPCATIQVWCFKRTEPKNFYNTILGSISNSGYVRWTVLPGMDQATAKPSLVFEVQIGDKQVNTKVAFVDEDQVLLPDSSDLSSSVQNDTHEGDNDQELDSVGTASHNMNCSCSNLDSASVFQADHSLSSVRNHISSAESCSSDLEGLCQQHSAGECSTDLDIVLPDMQLTRPKGLRNRSDLLSTPQSDQSSGNNSGCESDCRPQRSSNRLPVHVHSKKAQGKVPFKANTQANMEMESQEEQELEENSDSLDDKSSSDSDWSGGTGYKMESGDENLNSDSESRASSQGSVENSSESDHDIPTQSYSKKKAARQLGRSGDSSDPWGIEPISFDMEGHLREVIAEPNTALRPVITEKCYSDPIRGRPLNCPRIPRESLVRTCSAGDIVIISNDFLRKHVDNEFFTSFEPLCFHLFEVESNSDEDEILVVRRLIPLTLIGQNCSKAAREGRLKTLLTTGKLQGPFIYCTEKIEDIPAERYLQISIDHSPEAGNDALLAILKQEDNPQKCGYDSGDYFHKQAAGILVLCHAGKQKIYAALKSLGQRSTTPFLSGEPQLMSWDIIRKQFTVNGFFSWADDYHSKNLKNAITRDKVWRAYLLDDLSFEVQTSVACPGTETSFAALGKVLANLLSDTDRVLTHIARKVKSIVMEGCDGEEGNGPLNGISHWSMLFCVDTGWAEHFEDEKNAEQTRKFYKRFISYCSRSLDYYVDGDVIIFGGNARPTPTADKGKFPFVVKGCILEVLSVCLRKKCRLEVKREGSRVLYLPSKPTVFEKPSTDSPELRYINSSLVKEVEAAIKNKWTRLLYEVRSKHHWDPTNPVVRSVLQRMIVESDSQICQPAETQTALNSLQVCDLPPLSDLSADELKTALQELRIHAEKLIVEENSDNLYQSQIVWEVEAKQNHRHTQQRHKRKGQVQVNSDASIRMGRKRSRRELEASDDSDCHDPGSPG